MAAAAATSRPLLETLLAEAAERRAPDARLLLRLADRIHAHHVSAAPAQGGAAAIRAHIARSPEPLRSAQIAELERHAQRVDARAAAGRVRPGHGGLRLAQIGLVDGAPVLPEPASQPADILFDLAALLADLGEAGLASHASIVANRYADVAPQGASGWALLPLFVSAQAREPGFAAEALAPVPPAMVVVAGLSGTGKTTLARLIGARLGRAPGARVLRSDVFRKRIAGVSPETRLPPSSYTLENDEDTLAAMFESADDHLGCGTSVILDGVFMRRSERDIAAMLADRWRAPFTGIWLEAPERDRVARVNERAGYASDAGAEVAREQSRRPVGDLSGWHRIRVNRPLELVVSAARGAIERRRR